MFKAFLKDSAIYGIGGILARAISLLLLPLYTRALTPADYGVADLLTTFGALVNLTVALEVSQGLARYVPESADAEERGEWASTALWVTVTALTLFAIGALLFAPQIAGALLESRDHTFVFRLAIASIVLNGIFYLGQVQLRWKRQPTLFSIANLAYMLSAIGATVVFVLQFRMGVAGVIWGQIVGFLTGTMLTYFFARDDFRFRFSLQKCRLMLAFSLPLIPSSIAMFVATYIDRIAIKELLDVGSVGIYGVGYRLATPVALLTGGFQAALTPLVIANYRDPATRETIARIFRYFLVLAMLACVGISIFAREALAIFATAQYAGAAPLVALLAPALLLPTMYVFAPGLFIAKKTKSSALVIGLSAVMNTVLNFTLIPLLGVTGSALASFTSALIAFGVFMTLSQREYHVPHEWRTILLAAGGCVATIGVAAMIPVTGLRDLRGIGMHALLAAAAAVWLPVVLLGVDEIRLILQKMKGMLAKVRG